MARIVIVTNDNEAQVYSESPDTEVLLVCSDDTSLSCKTKPELNPQLVKVYYND